MRNTILLMVITVISILFFLAIGFNVSPYLRGPASYPPDWQWPYQFTNTVTKIWVPLLSLLGIAGLFFLVDKLSNKEIVKKKWFILFLLILFHFIFQLSILFFSRAGISVLLQRIINPDSNGYFTTALSIKNIPDFLGNYNRNVLSFSMHATGHPPGSILFFWLINQIAILLSPIQHIVTMIHPSHADVRLVWELLTLNQKTGALISGLLIPLLSSLSLPLIFFIGKELYSIRTAMRSCFLYLVIPSIVLFIPLSDVFFPLFFLSSFLLLLKGLKNNNYLYLFFAGLCFFTGLFFSMSLLPLSFLFVYLVIFHSCKNSHIIFFRLFKYGLILATGFLILPILLFIFFHFNSPAVAKTLMNGLPKGRQYHVWVFYNLYDFFIYMGIPLLLIYAKMIVTKLKDHLFIAFTIMLFLLDISGSVRGEVGRIWLPFASVFVLFIANFLTDNRKMSSKDFIYILLLQATQIIVMQEFWVPLW